MPTIELSHRDLCGLIGRELAVDELRDAVVYAKSGIDAVNGDTITIKVEDTNRPDLWSAEGIAREIKGRLNPKGCPRYEIKKSGVVVTVDKKNKSVRPFTVCAVVKNLKVTEAVLSQMIQLQEKVCETFGRNRKEVALGVYDFDRIKPPIRFTTVKPSGVKFSPLDFEEEMTPKEILEKHPKGREYGRLLAGMKEYPIFIDARNEILSMPPVINSNYSGKVTEDTKNLFIECSGFKLKFLVPALNVIVAALADRGGEIESVKVVYPGKTVKTTKTIVTPDLSPRKGFVEMNYVNEISGLKLGGDEVCKLLEQANYDAKLAGKRIEVNYPAYRQDIMHQRDIVEDVAISYGYNRIEPVAPRLKTAGGMDGHEVFSDRVAGVMAGLGFQEILSYTLTNKENLFRKMNVKETEVVEIENPVSTNWCVFRNCLLPSLMDFFSNNQHVDYPQRVFEVGDAVLVDSKEESRTRNARRLAAAISDSRVVYGGIASVLDAFLRKLNVKYELKKLKKSRRSSLSFIQSSFIDGRVADILVKNKIVGFVGEIHPAVLGKWKLEMPVAAFEIDVERLWKLMKK